EQAPPAGKLTLDEAPTVEVNAQTASTLEGFETTSHEGPLDIPSGGMLGLEPTAAQDTSPDVTAPAPAPDGLDTITLDDFSVPTTGAAPASPAPPVTTPAAEQSGGLLDFDSFELG